MTEGGFKQMRKVTGQVLCIIILLLFGCEGSSEAGKTVSGKVRPPAVAGQFYPSDPDMLRRAVEGYLQDARKPTTDKPTAIVVPHAGYVYSGQISADAFNQAAGRDYDLIVVLGTNHTTAGFRGMSVYPSGGYRTPLGTVEIDADVASVLIASDDDIDYTPEVHQREHSVEVQIPFVQTLFPNVKVLCAIVGDTDLKRCERFGEKLTEVVKDRKVLIVASSDLSHYPDYSDAFRVDAEVLTAAASLDPNRFQDVIACQLRKRTSGLSTCACGEAPILTAMFAAEKLGALHGTVISYANSGDVLVGDPSRVVGYGAVVFSKGNAGKSHDFNKQERQSDEAAPLNDDEKKYLLKLARKSIERYLGSETLPLIRDVPPRLKVKQGAFVTLNKHHRLRGCIGHMAEDMPLCRVVGVMALQAALNDHRFPQVSFSEVDELEIEISVLTPYKPIAGPDEIVIGRDGVVIRKGSRSAVYLPQVAVEQGWGIEEMLDNLCRKAGLSVGAWRENAQLLTFQAEVFSE